jgi:hypothetical protein
MIMRIPIFCVDTEYPGVFSIATIFGCQTFGCHADIVAGPAESFTVRGSCNRQVLAGILYTDRGIPSSPVYCATPKQLFFYFRLTVPGMEGSKIQSCFVNVGSDGAIYSGRRPINCVHLFLVAAPLTFAARCCNPSWRRAGTAVSPETVLPCKVARATAFFTCVHARGDAHMMFSPPMVRRP